MKALIRSRKLNSGQDTAYTAKQLELKYDIDIDAILSKLFELFNANFNNGECIENRILLFQKGDRILTEELNSEDSEYSFASVANFIDSGTDEFSFVNEMILNEHSIGFDARITGGIQLTGDSAIKVNNRIKELFELYSEDENQIATVRNILLKEQGVDLNSLQLILVIVINDYVYMSGITLGSSDDFVKNRNNSPDYISSKFRKLTYDIKNEDISFAPSSNDSIFSKIFEIKNALIDSQKEHIQRCIDLNAETDAMKAQAIAKIIKYIDE